MSLVQDPSTATAANVTGPSTAPTAADAALVVTLSPNSASITASNPSVSSTGAAVPTQATFVGAEVQTLQSGLTLGDLYPLSLTTQGLLRIDGSNVTQPVSGTVTVTQSTAANLLATIIGNTAAGSGASTGLVTIQGNASGTPVPVSGSVTVSQATAGNLNATVFQGTSPWVVSQSTAANLNATVVQSTASNLRTQTSSESATGAAVPTNAAFVGGEVQALQSGLTAGDLYPLSLTTAGLLRVDGSNVTQPVSGTVTAQQSTAANLNATVVGTTAAGSGASSGLITIQGNASGTPVPVSGTITATRPADSSFATQNITAQDTSSTSTAAANGASYVTGTPSANSAATFTVTSQQALSIQVTGTWTGTLTLESSIDGGTTWFTHGVKQYGASYVTSSFTANFIGDLNCSGETSFRARATAAWTGTATVLVRETYNIGNIYINNPITFRDATTQSIANTIKAASTAAVATDTALVVAVSPNNSVAVTQGTSPWVVSSSGSFNNASVSATGAAVPSSATFVGGEVQALQSGLTAGDLYPLSLTTQGLLRVDGSNVTQPVSGTVTANQGGTWTVQQGTPPWTVQGDAANGAAVAGNPVLAAGYDGTDARTILTDTSGRQEVVGAAASGAAAAGNPVLIGGSDGTDARTISTDVLGRPVVNFPPGTADVFGQMVAAARLAQVSATFFQGSPSFFLTVTTSGGATATQGTGTGVFTSGTSATADVKGVTPSTVFYSGHYEIYAAFTASFTTPTSSATFQRLGLYNTTDGFAFGYSGTTFGLWTRYNGTDTFVAQTSWNVDTLAAASNSKFTSGGSPVSLVQTDINLYRIRTGWLGIAPVVFEVLSPDGNFVVVHVVKAPNSQTTVTVTNPDLPMTVEVSKTAADSTSLVVTSGCWVAGVSTAIGSDLYTIGALGSLNATVSIPMAGLASVGYQIAAGTFVGTIVPEFSFDGGQTWNASFLDNGATSNITSSLVFGSSNTASAGSIVGVGGGGLVRLRVSAYTSGTCNVTLRGSDVADPSQLTEGQAGSAVPPSVSLIGGSDGTLLRALATDTSGHPIIVGDGTAGSPAGGVVSVQGVSGGTAMPIGGLAAAGSAATGNPVEVGGVYNTTSPAPANGNIEPFQIDQAGNLLTFPGDQFIAGAAWSSATALNTVQYQTGTTTIGQLLGANSVVIQLDQTTTITAGAVTFQGTYDGTNWISIPTNQVFTLAGAALNQQITSNPYTFVANTNAPFLIWLQGFIAVRMQLTTAITGTGTVTPYWSTRGAPVMQTAVTLGQQSNPIVGGWTSGTGLNNFYALTCVGYSTIVVTLNQTTTLTGGQVTFEVTDTEAGTNWYPAIAVNQSGAAVPSAQGSSSSVVAPSSVYTFVANTNAAFQIPVAGWVQFRMRLSTVISGTGAVNFSIAGNHSVGATPVVGTIQPIYGPQGQSLTITLASLANAAARQCTSVNNLVNLYEDALLFVTVATATSGVSATGYVNVYGYGSVNNGTNYGDTVTGTDGTITLTSPPNLVLLAQINTVANSTTYRFGPFSFCRNYGLDRLPALWGVVIVNESGAALAASGSSVTYQPVNGQI
jgi:hypothetical protein